MPGTALLLRWANLIVLEVAGAVGLRPKPHLAGHGWTQNRIVRGIQIRVRRTASSGNRLAAQRILERERAIDPGFKIGARNRQLQLVPGVTVQHERLRAIAELNV